MRVRGISNYERVNSLLKQTVLLQQFPFSKQEQSCSSLHPFSHPQHWHFLVYGIEGAASFGAYFTIGDCYSSANGSDGLGVGRGLTAVATIAGVINYFGGVLWIYGFLGYLFSHMIHQHP